MTNIVSSKGYAVDVQSSTILTIAYLTSNESLWVKFKSSGECYEYPNVAKLDAEDLRTAPSHGMFLNSNIKGTYSHRKVSSAEFDVFCTLVKQQCTLVPIVNINWNAVSAAADQMVWNRC